MSPLATLLLLLVTLPARTSPDTWLLVRDDGPGVGSLTWDRIAEVYLGRIPHRVVRATQADDDPSTSRLIVGSPRGSPALAALAPGLGLRVVGDALELDGVPLPRGAGLVLLGDDPDGGGHLAVFTGADASAVFECFRTSIDLAAHDRFAVREGRRVELRARGDTTRPSIVRLDRDVERLLDEARDDDPSDVALRIERALQGWAFVLENVVGRPLAAQARTLLASDTPERSAARDLAGRIDLSTRIRELHERVELALGPAPGPSPAYVVTYGDARGTNAQTRDADPTSGRPLVVLNLLRLTVETAFDVAVLHETIHTRQPAPRSTLLEVAMREGVASLLSQRLRPGASDAAALMWTEDELAAARARSDALLAAFVSDAASDDPTRKSAFLVLGHSPSTIPDAPSRCGYWIGMRAAAAWLGEDESRTARDLLAADPDALLDALLAADG